MDSFKGRRGEALSMSLIVVAMALSLDFSDPGWMDWISLMIMILALGRIIWIFPTETKE